MGDLLYCFLHSSVCRKHFITKHIRKNKPRSSASPWPDTLPVLQGALSVKSQILNPAHEVHGDPPAGTLPLAPPRAGAFRSPRSGPWTRSQPAALVGPALGGRVPGPAPTGSPHQRSLHHPRSADCSWVGPTVRALSHTGRETEAENGRSLSQGLRDSSTNICSVCLVKLTFHRNTHM